MANYEGLLETKVFEQYFAFTFKTKKGKKEQMVVAYDLIKDQAKIISTK